MPGLQLTRGDRVSGEMGGNRLACFLAVGHSWGAGGARRSLQCWGAGQGLPTHTDRGHPAPWPWERAAFPAPGSVQPHGDRNR